MGMRPSIQKVGFGGWCLTLERVEGFRLKLREGLGGLELIIEV